MKSIIYFIIGPIFLALIYLALFAEDVSHLHGTEVRFLGNPLRGPIGPIEARAAEKVPDGVKIEYIGHSSGNAGHRVVEVHRLVDNKAHVLCYFTNAGISCMPLHDFPLEGKVNLGIYK